MSEHSILVQLLEQNNWESYQPMMDDLSQWQHYPLFLDKLNRLNRSALYASHIHGEGHIERTLLHGALCAMADELNAEDTALLLDACSYHDVGRVDDSYDLEHGYRSSLRLEELTGSSGQELLMLRAAVEAHSRNDADLEEILRSYDPVDFPRTLLLAQLLKDADGLDRVRICDLDVRYLRRPSSPARAEFAHDLYRRYQALLQQEKQ